MVHSIYKKGSLNLSVEAIVILVMAITMLGLGLGFIRDKFGGAGDLIDDVQEKVKEDVQRDLSDNHRKVSFPKTEFKLGQGESEVALVGIKNQGDSAATYAITIKCPNDKLAGETDCDDATFIFSPSYEGVGAGEVQLAPIKIDVGTETLKDSYLYQLEITETIGDGAPKLYSTKQFYVKVI